MTTTTTMMTTTTVSETMMTEERTDLLCYLQNLKRLFDSNVEAFNSLSRTSIQLALAVESCLLLIKLNQTSKRWIEHLPFFEFHDVEFGEWGESFRKWSEYMGKHALREEYLSYKPFVPNINFYVDLIDALRTSEDSAIQYDQMTPETYVESGDPIRDVFSDNRGRYLQLFEDTVLAQLGQTDEGAPGFTLVNQSENIRKLCCSQLIELSDRLIWIDNMLKGVHSDDAYINLYERVIYQRCEASKRQAVTYVEQWLTDQHPSDVSIDAKVKFLSLKLELENNSLLKQLTVYLNFDKSLQDQHAAVGRFLFEHRRELFNAEPTLKKAIEIFMKMEQFQQIALHGIIQDESVNTADTPLDPCFTEKFRNNPRAIQNFVRLLKEDEPSLGTKQHEANGGKKWGHLYTALKDKKLEIIYNDSSPLEFARAVGHQLHLSDKMIKKISRYARSDRYSLDRGKAVIDFFIKRYKTVWG